MSDPKRTPDPLAVMQALPQGAAYIYRHFGAANRFQIAEQLRQSSFERDIQLLIGADPEMAQQCGADGVHLPQRDLGQIEELRHRYPNWMITGAAHDRESVPRAKGFDAVFVSPIFSSASPSADIPLGINTLKQWVKIAPCPVIALGGINHDTAPQLLQCGIAGIAGVSGFAPTGQGEGAPL